MEFMLRRLIESSIIANRNDADWIRTAISKDAEDLNGTVATATAGGVLTDRSKRWPFNLYGAFDSDGLTRPGSQLTMLTGAAEGSVWTIVTAVGDTIEAIDGLGAPVDFVAAGVVPGDYYAIRVDQHERAISFFSDNAIRVLIGWPQDASSLPCYAINLASGNEISRWIGNQVNSNSGTALEGPVIAEYRTRWREGLSISCWSMNPDQTVWMYRALEHVYLQSIEYLASLYLEGLLAQGAEMTTNGNVGPAPVYVRNFTIGGVLERSARKEIPWIKESAQTVVTTLNPMQVALAKVANP